MEDNISIFDMDTGSIDNISGNSLDVVMLDFVGAESLSWQDLFSGFDNLKAITFSSGINFIYKLVDMFEHVEIVFGCEDVISASLQDIMAYQGKLIEKLRGSLGKQKESLIDRIHKGEVRFFVSRNKLSHEKLYLLSSDDGRKRVIMGSANMSFNAFSGRQRENICYIDGERAYEWYESVFDSLKNNSTDEISQKAFVTADLGDNIDALPIAETVKVKKAIVIEPVQEEVESVKFILSVDDAAKRLKPSMPKLNKTNGKVYVSPENIIRIKRQVESEAIKEKEQRAEYPQLRIEHDLQSVSLNGEKLDLSPSAESVKSDVEQFAQYMDGYSIFHGDVDGMQLRYFEFANWFFCSPFMAIMRDYSARYDKNQLPYPVFGLLYGQSKAGKTSFLETLLKMMIGQKPKISAPDFTRSSIEALKRTVQGAPIIVDDLTQTRFNQHAIETIKNDDFGFKDHLTNYPAVVISANEDVKAVAPEVIRRTVICRVEAGLTNTEVMKSNVVRSVQQKVGTAFYREYLRRMLEHLPEMVEELKNDDSSTSPDVLKVSSEIILAILKENLDIVPDYFRPLSLDSYFSEEVTGKHAIKVIQTAWTTDRSSFKVSKKTNELRYNAGATYEADRLMKELPETLEAHKSREWVVMNLDEAKSFFKIDFKPRLFLRN